MSASVTVRPRDLFTAASSKSSKYCAKDLSPGRIILSRSGRLVPFPHVRGVALLRHTEDWLM
jgi:hypothetical protein